MLIKVNTHEALVCKCVCVCVGDEALEEKEEEEECVMFHSFSVTEPRRSLNLFFIS